MSPLSSLVLAPCSLTRSPHLPTGRKFWRISGHLRAILRGPIYAARSRGAFRFFVAVHWAERNLSGDRCKALAMKHGPENILPQSLAPRGLSREQAAAYVGVSPSLFDILVKDGRMPAPKRVNARTVWDRLQLDAAFRRAPEQRRTNKPMG